MKNKCIVFDLDDTLIAELSYLKSAYREIANLLDGENAGRLYNDMYCKYQQGEDVFNNLVLRFKIHSKDELLNIYRNHFPNIALKKGAVEIFELCKVNNFAIGLITDGRTITQRNKLQALGIINVFDKIIISEEFGTSKPDSRNYEAFHHLGHRFLYVGDNVTKDFVTANDLGWDTVCLLNKGQNIHIQNFDLPANFLPKYKIEELHELEQIIKL